MSTAACFAYRRLRAAGAAAGAAGRLPAGRAVRTAAGAVRRTTRAVRATAGAVRAAAGAVRARAVHLPRAKPAGGYRYFALHLAAVTRRSWQYCELSAACCDFVGERCGNGTVP